MQKKSAKETRKCVIKIWGREIDMVKLYRDAGFKTILPQRLTIDGLRLRSLSDVPANYTIQDQNGVVMTDGLSVGVEDGDEFFAVPPASY